LKDDFNNNDFQAQVGSYYSYSDDSHCCQREPHHETIFASYRNNTDQKVLCGDNVLFNIESSNKGCGIDYDRNTGFFRVECSGFYLINYGLASIGTAGKAGSAFGFRLTRTRHGHHEIVDSALAGSSSGVILCLNKGDKISVVAPDTVVLHAGSLPPRTTSFTDTAFISFLKIQH
jgi:hypothetical protein